eukprot:4655469-Pyramimonas_sp.AAC.1
MGRLQRAWLKLAEVLERNPIWQQARGPLSACWLTLLRISWNMVNAHTLCTDQGATISLMTVSPYEVRLALIEGIQRWHIARLITHMFALRDSSNYEAWPRALQSAIK